MRVLCDCCEGTGRVRPRPYDQSTMLCPDNCDDGYFPAQARDFDGLRVSYGYVIGTAFIYHGTLALETETGLLIVNLKPEDLEAMP